MNATVQLARWGNGQGIRLTKAMAEEAGLHIGDELNVAVEADRIVITAAKKRYVNVPDYEALFSQYHGEQPAEDGFAAAVGRERA